MSRLIFFLESYTAGGSDQVAKSLLENLRADKIFLVINKNIDERILFTEELGGHVSVHRYGLVTPADLGLYANKFKRIKSAYFMLKCIDYLFRYPLLIYSIFYFYFFIKKFNPTHILAHNGGYPGGLYCGTVIMASSFVSSIKHRFYAFHSMPFPLRKSVYVLDLIWDKILDRICSLISVSKASSQRLKELRYFKQYPHCIYNGLEGRNLKSYHRYREIRILHVGYFDFNKNQIFLLKSLKLLISRGFTNLKVTFVGDVDDVVAKLELDNFIKENELSKIVKFAGFQKSTSKYYELNDILVCTSKIESFPLVILEAMRVGMPVISTNVGGIKEQISDGKNGFLVDVDDVEFLSQKIQTFYENSNLIEVMGRESNRIFKEKFQINNMINGYNRTLQLVNK